MDTLIVAMLNALGQGPTGGTGDLLKSPQQYNSSVYDAMMVIHSTAVKPVTSLVLAIILSMTLATNSTRVDGDRELGVRIIAATMFKAAMVLTAVQVAPMFLDAISQVAVFISSHAANANIAGSGGGTKIGDQLKGNIDDAGTIKQLGMLVVLLIPFILAKAGSAVAVVLVFVRFLQMYLMSAFSSLPVAFLAHEETKSIGIGYLKRFSVVALTGTVLIVAVKLYQALIGGWLDDHLTDNSDAMGFIVDNFGNFLVAPMVLLMLLFGANSLAKAVLGEG